MSSPFIGQIMAFPGTFAPDGWAFCDGALLSVSDYQELFNLIGTTYGGDGSETFALPDLRGRVAIGQGHGPGLSSYPVGTMVGQEEVTLTVAQLPPHSHPVHGANTPGNSDVPASNTVLASPGGQAGSGQYETPAYAPPGVQTALNAASVGYAGGHQQYSNLQPYLTMNFCIALTGAFPHQ